MESTLRHALIDWLAADPLLGPALNSITEEAPLRAEPPWLGLVASASTDWSTKDRQGREVRIAFELHGRGDGAGETAAMAGMIEDRIASMPPDQSGFRIVTCHFLRARAEQRANNARALLVEYRFRLLEA